jgi:signal transduction histidine kinase
LSPTILEDFGLYAAIRWLVNNFAKNYNIKVNFEMIDIDILIPRYDHVLVYRIVQEALTNIGKHSQARNASVTSSTDGITVLISIDDDGMGFDPNKVVSGEPGEKGLGLATMKGRAGMLGGVLGVRSQEGRGTRITLTIPIKRGGSL